MREGLHPVRWAREWASSGRLSKPEGDVLKELASYAGDAPVAWPSNATLAASVQQTEKTIRRALDGLEEKCLVTRSRDAVGRVLRSREHPIVLVVELVATPAAGQLQLDLGDQALVTADPQPRRRPAPPSAAPAVDEDELASRRRAKIAADAAQVGATLHALNAAAELASDDPGRPTTGGEGRQETPEVPGKVHKELQEEESARERALTPTSSAPVAGLPATFSAVMDELRDPSAFGAGVDIFDSSIAQVLRAHPEADGFDHLAAARMLIAEQHTAAAMGWKPIAVPSLKLAAVLGKQRGPQRAPAGRPASRRRGDQGHEQTPAAKPKRFVKQSSVEDPIFG